VSYCYEVLTLPDIVCPSWLADLNQRTMNWTVDSRSFESWAVSAK